MPRWFGLDTPDVKERIAAQPRLLGWVARTTDDDLTHRKRPAACLAVSSDGAR